MEERLNKISGSKTFSLGRSQKKSNDFGEISERFESREMIPTPPVPVCSSNFKDYHNTEGNIEFQEQEQGQGQEQELIATKTNNVKIKKKENNQDHKTFANFIANDEHIFWQRKLLMQQEHFQKHSTASRSTNLNTKGLNLNFNSEEFSLEKIKSFNVITWPQYEPKFNDLLNKNNTNNTQVQSTIKSNINKAITKEKKPNRFWSALFPETTKQIKNNEKSRIRRIFPDPAYILHLAILNVKDEREPQAMYLLKRRLPSLNLLKKANLRSLVNELFLRSLDKGFDDLVILLINSGFPENFNYSIYGNLKQTCRRFPSYLLLAVGLGRLKVVQRILEIQPRVQLNRGWFNGLRPLMLAQMTKKIPGQSFAITQLLLKHGAESNRTISYSTYLKGLAFIFRHVKLKNGRSNLKISTNDKPKRIARGRKEIYRKSVLFALDFACSREKFESAHLILATPNSSSWLQRNEFCLLQLDSFEVAWDILQRVPDLVKQRDPRGSTPLHWAAKQGRTDLIALYLQYTSAVDCLNSSHWTPLHEAAAGAHRPAVQYLISRGADCSIKNLEGLTALEVARKKGISSEEIFDFFHSADTIQRTRKFLGELVVPKIISTINPTTTEETQTTTTTGRLLIQKFMKYPKKLWKRSFNFS